jgi:hypothetical protein
MRIVSLSERSNPFEIPSDCTRTLNHRTPEPFTRTHGRSCTYARYAAATCLHALYPRYARASNIRPLCGQNFIPQISRKLERSKLFEIPSDCARTLNFPNLFIQPHTPPSPAEREPAHAPKLGFLSLRAFIRFSTNAGSNAQVPLRWRGI